MKSYSRSVLAATFLAFLSPVQWASAQHSDPAAQTHKTATDEQIETKFILASGQDGALQQLLKLRPDKATERKVYFYDTKALDLYKRGLILRARTNSKKHKGDVTVKILPATYNNAGTYQNVAGYKCEIDATGNQQTSACSLTAKKANTDIEASANIPKNKGSIQLLLTLPQQQMAQRAFSFDWNELVAWGPIQSQVWKKKAGALPFAFTVEQWILTSGQEVTEVSIRTPQKEAQQDANILKAYLVQRGLKLADKQESKTALALRE